MRSLRGRTAGSIGPKERANLSILVKEKPSLDIEITFNYNSDAVSSEAMRVLRTLGRALANVELKGNTFLISGHTDAKGGDEFNQNLSERRAETVRRILVKELKISKNALIAVGYGKTQLKNTADPLASENRRVQIINTEQPASAM
jgi:outer membrane protein OmpA-like peptidoglycan-associated protein